MPVNFFNNIVNVISSDSEALQEVQEGAKKFLKEKKKAVFGWKEPRNKRILGDATNLIPVPVAEEKRKNYDANIIDISSKRIKVPINNVTTFEASSNMQYLLPQNALACIPPILKYSPEANVCEAVDTNIYSILNELMGMNYDFSSRKPYVSEPDFTCYHNDDLIMVVEVKRRYILKKTNERTLSEFYTTIKYMATW
ncbi:22349_t:CDS:2 [Cetraspora pellucida]|uniref:22349_t:CDS:1 n=1 Tax=Cetraspora pellucida TaxID=1433469 RepID=A0A9N8VTN5_9GLOM|nr:22349_t:CDS:2 [Cetraspora pellucida]